MGNYDDLCRLIGQFFLESRHQLDQARKYSEALQAKLSAVEKERDDALQALQLRDSQG